MTPVFEGVSYTDALKRAEETEVWIVDQVIGAHTTLLYGEAKVGKSFLVSALVKSLATGTDYLGKPVPVDRDFNIAVCWTDDAGEAEYSDRIRSVMPSGEEPKVTFYQLPIMRDHHHWDALFSSIMEAGHNFVVVDNLAQCLDGSINDDSVVRRFFDGIRLFTRAGVPVVVVAHSSDKPGSNGYKPDTPMGSAYISQAIRWRIFARRSRRGNITLKFMGNHAEPHEMTVYHGAGARFDVLGSESADALKAKAEGHSRERSKATKDENLEIGQWIVENALESSARDAAQAYSDAHSGKPAMETVRSKITRRSIPIERVDGRWRLTEGGETAAGWVGG